MKKLTDLRKFHQLLNDAYYEIELEEPFPNYFYQALLDGENEIYQKSITEVKTFHEEWIETIESFFPSLYKIASNPKSGLRYEQEVTAIEKAKRVNSDSVRHLAANTHLIKEYRDNNVIPKRILVTNAEIEYAIYENRFIKTLVDRLYDFIDRRYSLVKKNIDSFNKKHFNMKSFFQVEDSKVNMNINFVVTEDVQDKDANKRNHEMLKRIEYLIKQINNLKQTQFMEQLKNAKPVFAPIMQTSILLKNVDYKNCYNLWLFLDKYHTLDFDNDVSEQNLSFDSYYMKNIYQLALQTFSTIYANQKALEDHYQYLDTREYHKKSPKITKKHIETIVDKADNLVVENNDINQYYLEQSKKILDENIEKYQNESSSYEISLKKAIRDTQNITNALFESYFNLESDHETDDFLFKALVKESTEDLINKAKEKLNIARIIRETKEVDYNNTIRLEKRLMNEIENLDKQFIKESKKRIRDDAERSKVEEKIKIERDHLEENKQALNSYLAYVFSLNKSMIDEHKSVTKKISETRKQIKIEEKEIIIAEKKKAKLIYQEELRKIKEKQHKNKVRLELKVSKQSKLEEQRLTKQTTKIKTQSENRIKKELKTLEISHQKKKAKLLTKI